MEGSQRRPGVKKKFQKTLILVFEVIMQPPKTHFLTFSKVQKHIMEKKSETKIMNIKHSVACLNCHQNKDLSGENCKTVFVF